MNLSDECIQKGQVSFVRKLWQAVSTAYDVIQLMMEPVLHIWVFDEIKYGPRDDSWGSFGTREKEIRGAVIDTIEKINLNET